MKFSWTYKSRGKIKKRDRSAGARDGGMVQVERNEGERFGDFVIRIGMIKPTTEGKKFHEDVSEKFRPKNEPEELTLINNRSQRKNQTNKFIPSY